MSDSLHGQPNILWLVVDCLRYDHCPTDYDDTLPVWSKLAETGVSFSQYISTGSTTPICFGTMLTGNYPFGHGIHNMRGYHLNPKLPTLPEILKSHGYTTYAYMTGPMITTYQLDRGFDYYEHRASNQSIYSEAGRDIIATFQQQKHEAPFFSVLHLFELHRPHYLGPHKRPRRNTDRYRASWEHLNDELMAIIDALPENTIVVLTADHGEVLTRRADYNQLSRAYRHLRQFLKRPLRTIDWKYHGFYVYDELCHIPLVIRAPGLEAARIKPLTRQVDLMPTMLELLGITPPSTMHGRSLLPLIRKEEDKPRQAYIQTGWIMDDPLRSWHALRDERWKYVEHPRCSGHLHLEPTLYDLQNDPHETTNVIQQYRQIAISMRQQLDELMHANQADSAEPDTVLSSQENRVLEDQLSALGYL